MTKVVFLIGEKASRSYSPPMYNAAFKESLLDMIYVPLDIERGDFQLTKKFFDIPNVVGANVTMPHKVDAYEMISSLTDNAKVCGAVNLIYYESGILTGDNTDVISLKTALSNENRRMELDGAVIFGAGGVARADIYALIQSGINKIYIFNRTLEKAEKLANGFCSLKGSFDIPKNVHIEAYNLNGLGIMDSRIIDENALSRFAECLGQSSIIVNATSCADLLLPEMVASAVFSAHKDIIICDLVYQPFETGLLAQAKRYGLKTINGLELLLNQALPSFQKWTGSRANEKIMLSSLVNSSGIEAEDIYKLGVKS